MRKLPAVGKIIEVVMTWRNQNGNQYCRHKAEVIEHHGDGMVKVRFAEENVIRLDGVWYPRRKKG